MTVQVHDARLPNGMLEVDTDDPKAAAAAAQKYIAAQGKPAPKAAPPPPQPNTYADIVKSAARGLAESGAGAVGAPGDLANAATDLVQWGGRKLGIPDSVMNYKIPGTVAARMPGSADANNAIQSVTGAYHVPQTTAGKYAETIASFAPLALAPGGMIARAGRVVAAGVGSQGAGDVAQDMGAGPGMVTAARVVGGLGGAAAATGTLRSINAFSVGKGGPAIIDPNDIAASKMRAAVASDGGPEVVGRNSAAWADSGASGPTLVDVGGNNVRRLVRASASGGTGQAQNIATDYAGRVRANFQDQVIDHTNGLTPGVRDAASTYADKLEKAQSDVASTTYKEPYSQPAAVTPDMVSALQGREGASAIHQAWLDASANRDLKAMSELKDLEDVAGNRGATPNPLTGQKRSLQQALDGLSAGSLDRVRIAMRDTGRSLAAAGRNSRAGGYFGRVGDIDTALDQTPGLQPARAVYRQMQGSRDALDLGGTVLTNPSNEYAASISELAGRGGPPNLGPGLQVGARQALVNKLETGADGATGAAKTISQSSRATQNLGQTFGQERAAQYQAAVGNEVKRVGNADYISPNTGSQTELRGQDTASLISKVPHSIYDMAIRVFDTVRGHGAPLTEAERAAIVRMGTTEADLSNLVRRNPNLNRAAIAQIAASNSSQRK